MHKRTRSGFKMDSMTKKLFTFVLMPFDSTFDDIYKLGIKDTCENLDVYCERVDEQIFEEKILDRIYNQINKADIIVADMTGKNANVFYETGYAHALNKKVILLTQNSDDIPFDLKHYHHIVYDGKILKLKEELAKRITWFKNHPDKRILPNDFEIAPYIQGIELLPGTKIELKQKHSSIKAARYYAKAAIDLKIDLQNKGIAMFDSILKVGVATEFFNRNSLKESKKVIKLNNKQYLHISKEFTKIFPSDWRAFELTLLSDDFNGHDVQKKDLNMTVKIFSELGVKDIPIVIHYKEIDKEL